MGHPTSIYSPTKQGAPLTSISPPAPLTDAGTALGKLSSRVEDEARPFESLTAVAVLEERAMENDKPEDPPLDSEYSAWI